MKNIFAILRRDLGAYFTSPIGYIFMMVFVTMSVGLYITSFFTFPMADMRPYFENLPLLLCVFVPAVTMRVWAEERKENTWEMLLTFPMKASELVLGKFLAILIFYCATLAATFTVPAMLFSLGNPDPGAIFGGYLGTFLLGAFFLSLGIFFSGFCKDQIVAFVITLLTCFGFFLLGTQFIASYLDDKFGGLGSLLSDLVGLFTHFSPFSRGVLDIADVLYFVVWTCVFLALNVMYIDGRNRPGARMIFGSAVAICVAIGLLFNYLMIGQSFGRMDMTEDNIYTISKASKSIIADADSNIQVNLYITPKEKMPTGMKDLEQDIVDKLEELSVASDGKLEYKTLYLDVANLIADPNAKPEEEEEKDEEKSIEERIYEKGVQPFNVQAMSQDEMTSKLVYASLGIAYKTKAEEIIPQIIPRALPELEYRLVSTIHKLTREKVPVVALVAPKEAVNIDPQMRAILMQMGQPVPQSEDPYIFLEQILQQEKYDVQRVELTKESPLPEEYDTLAVVNPRSLNERQRWEINRAIHSGKSVLMAVQQYEWDYKPTPQGNSVTRRDENPGINELLASYGLGVSKDVLMDANAVPLTISGGGGGLAGLLGQPFKLPMHMLINNESMDPDTAITNRLEGVFYLWGTALDLDEAKLGELGLDAKTIMTTSDRAWTIDGAAQMTASSFEEPLSKGELYKRPLMAVIEGQFPDAFADQERPAWPKPQQQPGMPPQPPSDDEEPPAEAVEAQPGKVILLGCSQLFRKNFLEGSSNLDLFLNSVDGLSLNENLVHVRGRKPINRFIDDVNDQQKTIWRLANYGLANLLIAGIGIAVLALRRRSRNAYTMSMMNQ